MNYRMCVPEFVKLNDLFTVNGIISLLISFIGTSVPATPNKLAIAIYVMLIFLLT